MFLFKASGKTYPMVLRQAVHAFPCSPKADVTDKLVLLSKNREDCRVMERQIQNVAKIVSVRPVTAVELDQRFPGVDAGSRWTSAVEFNWLSPLDTPFNLAEVQGLDHTRYDTVRYFSELDEGDATAVVKHLCASNPKVVFDLINRR